MPVAGHVSIAGPRRLVDAPKPVFVRVFEYPQGYVGHTHRHRLAQVVYPIRGVVSVETRSGTWVVGQLTAVAIPPWREHRVSAHGNASLRSVFVDPEAHPQLVTDVASIRVTTLLHELIREAGHRFTDFDADDAVAVGVVSLIARAVADDGDRRGIGVAPSDRESRAPSRSPLRSTPTRPTRPRSRSGPRRLGFSPRHLARLFKKETGVSFSTWRSLHAVRHALALLAAGAPVTRVATDVGYSTTSAFIEMFKRTTGRTPGTYGRD